MTKKYNQFKRLSSNPLNNTPTTSSIGMPKKEIQLRKKKSKKNIPKGNLYLKRFKSLEKTEKAHKRYKVP